MSSSTPDRTRHPGAPGSEQRRERERRRIRRQRLVGGGLAVAVVAGGWSLARAGDEVVSGTGPGAIAVAAAYAQLPVSDAAHPDTSTPARRPARQAATRSHPRTAAASATGSNAAAAQAKPAAPARVTSAPSSPASARVQSAAVVKAAVRAKAAAKAKARAKAAAARARALAKARAAAKARALAKERALAKARAEAAKKAEASKKQKNKAHKKKRQARKKSGGDVTLTAAARSSRRARAEVPLRAWRNSPHARMIVWRESNGRCDVVSSNGLWRGTWQMTMSLWRANGGPAYASTPERATCGEQDKVAYRIWVKVGWAPWGG